MSDVVLSNMPDAETYITAAGSPAVKQPQDDVYSIMDEPQTKVLVGDGTTLSWSGTGSIPAGNYKVGMPFKQAAVARWVANHRPT